jgi:RimJ/RimL family protein N-acetyltransferase
MPSPKRRKPKHETPKPKAVKPKPLSERIAPTEVTIERVKGSRGKGGDAGGEAWRICRRGEKVGDVYINLIDEPPIGPHPSIQIYLNQTNQGLGIGRLGYRLASEESQYDTIYAHMRKANVASRRAAEEAGYVDASPPGFTQLIMRWRRKG